MLNVGPLELLVVLAVALIVVGPERLPELARSVGRALRQLRQIQDEVRTAVSSGVDDDMRQAAADFKKATGEIARAAGVGEVGRKTGRIGGTSKTTRPARPAAVTSTDAGDPADRAGARPDPETEPGGDTEVSGPPADRLVEDAAATDAPPAADADAPPAADEDTPSTTRAPSDEPG